METIQKILASQAPAMRALLANTGASAVSMREPAPIAASKIDEVLSQFETLKLPKLIELKDEARRFMLAMVSAEQPAYWLSLLGPSGTGKTMIARIITRFFRRLECKVDENRSSPSAIYRRAGGMLEWARCVEHMLQSDFGFMRQACEDWFLCLDDIGAEHSKLKDLSASKLFSILNARQGKFTVITANLGVDAISDNLDPRIASRLLRHGGTVIDTTGTQDYGIRKYLEQKQSA